MSRFSTFQNNNLFTGVELAAELPSTSPERRAFVVVGAYIQTSRGATSPSTVLNVDKPDLRFWLRKYEVNKSYLENDWDIVDHDLVDSIYLNNIQTLESLEAELEKYIQDFSIMEVAWKVDNPLP
jgi:hypothetical protein